MMQIVRDPSWERMLDQVAKSYYKLVLVVGPIGSGKSAKLKDVRTGYGFGHLNLGEELSRRLLAQPVRLRPAEAENIAQDLIRDAGVSRVTIDNTEILFENPIAIDPLKFLKQASCHRTIVASWTGKFDKSNLTYGIQGHPAYRQYTYTPEDTFVIVPTER